jgi:hypothetical protein
VLALSDIFPWDEAAATREVLACADDAGMVVAATRLLAPPYGRRFERVLSLLQSHFA